MKKKDLIIYLSNHPRCNQIRLPKVYPIEHAPKTIPNTTNIFYHYYYVFLLYKFEVYNK